MGQRRNLDGAATLLRCLVLASRNALPLVRHSGCWPLRARSTHPLAEYGSFVGFLLLSRRAIRAAHAALLRRICPRSADTGAPDRRTRTESALRKSG